MEEAKKKQRVLKIRAAVIFTVFFIGLMVFLFAGGNLQLVLSVFREDMTNDEIRDTLDNLGIRGYITIGILSMFQVILAFLPAEPVQVLAGLTFGLWRGTLACLAGVFVGNTVIFILYKIYGGRLTEWFQTNAEFDFEEAKDSPQIALIVFLLYFLPAIPYGLICFFSASIGIKYPRYIVMTTLGSIPSILIGVGLGHMALSTSWMISLGVFIVLLTLLFIMYKKKHLLFAKLNESVKKQKLRAQRNEVRKVSMTVLNSANLVSHIALGRKIKLRYENKVGKLEKPSIVLINHGSFLDFVYAGRMLRKEKPHFITARLYFYHRILGKLLKAAGSFPKSMFATDIENVKNCLTVISRGEILAMMPEARLSTVGRFEDIQDATYRFIKKMGVTVYALKLEGDFFAKPKWGDKTRGGAEIDVTLSRLFTKEEVATLPVEALKTGVEAALTYDEFKWLAERPHIHYKSKTLAKGLEYILTRCPSCGARHTIETKGMTVRCSACGMSATMNDRYGFVEGKPFDNFALWYDWQKEEMAKEIAENPDFALTHPVTLKHSSQNGKSFLRTAGKGVCTLDQNGLTYRGQRDGETVEKFFSLKEIYRLLFGAGEDFEIYEGKEIWYFVPDEIRACVDYYIGSELLKKHYDR